MKCNRILIVLLYIFSSTVFAGEHHAESLKFKSTHLTDNIWMLQGKGGNIAVVTGKQGILMIDAGYLNMSPALKKALKPFGGEKKLSYIINTHWHGDHTQGNKVFGQYANIVAHDNVRSRLLTSQEVKLFKMVSRPYPEIAIPSITYEKSMNLYFNGQKINIVHYANGHTDGDSIIFFEKSNVVHMGDHYFSGFFPFVDIDTGGNVLKMAANVKKVLALIDDKTIIIPGHGPLSTKVDLQDFYDMLIGTSNEVRVMKVKGKTLAAIKKTGLSNRWKDWTDGFLSTEVWIEIVYKSL
ncbi:MAG: MBL fold metallo-hydrolase [Gammaproteobacteria bacterium]|nr:MBL fold metallo-hydrolase [Gammaproteobacteria bacterium]